MANDRTSVRVYLKCFLLFLFVFDCLCSQNERKGKKFSENDEEVVVYTSAHHSRRNVESGSEKGFKSRTEPILSFGKASREKIDTEPLRFLNATDNSHETSNYTKSSLLQPFAHFFDSYFKHRENNRSLLNVNDTLLSNIARSNQENETSSESRTIASWLSETFGFPKKKPNRAELSLPYRSDLVISNPQSVDSSITGLPIGHMLSLQNQGIIRPSFIPQPEGFPGPHNPGSILLPSDLLETTGIDYWLNYIENAGLEGKPTSYEAPGSDAEESNFFRRPQPIPIRIGQKLNSRRPIPHHNEDYQDELPEKYPEEVDPPPQEKTKHFDTSPRCDKFTSHICVDDFEYPEQAIVDEIYKRRDMFELMYAEVKDNSPLVDGIPRHVEESYNYEHYYSGDGNDVSFPLASGSDVSKDSSGFICPSEVLYGKPKLARNLKGNWKVIVNAAEFTQTIRMEKCLKPNEKCNHITSNKVMSRCVQVNGVHRLVVFEKGKGFYIDTFRIPTACSCHVSKRKQTQPKVNHGYHSNSAIIETVDKNVPPTQLTNTLWSVLGSNALNENNFDQNSLLNNDAIRTQLAILQYLKNNRDVAGQISPENVLQQLTNLNGESAPQFSTVSRKPTNNPGNKQRQQIKYSTNEFLIPGMFISADQLSALDGEKVKPNAAASPQFINYPQSGTATYIRPGNGNGGAPVVQVIHVPVTSTNPFPSLKQNAEGPQTQIHPVYQPLFQLSAYESKKSTKNTDTKDDEHVYAASTPIPLSDRNSSKTLEEESEQVAVKVKKIDKRINFSYHPILEYITVSSNE